MNNTIETPKIGISGKVLQWEVINADGSIDRSCYRPSDNLITDVGLDMIAYYPPPELYQDHENTYSKYFCIGTGTAEPSATDTKLTTETYRNRCSYPTYASTTYSANGSDPYYVYFQRGVQTPLGALNGTYGEIGFSPTLTANADVFSKHRLKDENGDPTTITVSSAQQLRLKYVIVMCASPSTMTTGTIGISGIGNIDYQAKWQNMDRWSLPWQMMDYHGQPPSWFTNYSIHAIHSNLSFGDIGYSQGCGSATVASSFSTSTYVAGSHELYRYGYWSVDVANGTWYGVSLDAYAITNPIYLVKFSPTFVKANTHTMRFAIKVSWGRS
jgi:hypothetical protein